VKVPAELSCSECTLQWRWWSANSCIPVIGYGCYAEVLNSNGYAAAAWGVHGDCPGNCGGNVHCGCGEQFRNCADITVLPTEGSSTTAAPGTTAVSSTTTVTVTRRTASSTSRATSTLPISTTTSMQSSTAMAGCMVTGAEDFGGNDAKCARACAFLPAVLGLVEWATFVIAVQQP